MKDFIFNDQNNWFRKKYEYKLSACNSRYWTFKAALNLFLQRGGKTILETGCQRLEDDFGGGASSTIFCDFLLKYGGKLISIDNDENHLNFCEKLMWEYGYKQTYVPILGDSVETLKHFSNYPEFGSYFAKPTLFYFDSFDYPLHIIIERLINKPFTDESIAELHEKFSEQDIIDKCLDIIEPCQLHCLNEVKAAEPLYDKNTIILIDDIILGGGKPRLAKEWLLNNGWECILEDYQSLWVRK